MTNRLISLLLAILEIVAAFGGSTARSPTSSGTVVFASKKSLTSGKSGAKSCCNLPRSAGPFEVTNVIRDGVCDLDPGVRLAAMETERTSSMRCSSTRNRPNSHDSKATVTALGPALVRYIVAGDENQASVAAPHRQAMPSSTAKGTLFNSTHHLG